jgi:hypothetical protein
LKKWLKFNPTDKQKFGLMKALKIHIFSSPLIFKLVLINIIINQTLYNQTNE